MTITFTENELSSESLYEMFRLSMEEYVNEARGTPWDDRRERAQFLDQMSVESIKLIRADGEVVGFIDFRKNGANWNLHTMIVVPAWQSKGIGSIVLDGLMAATKCISLSVLRTNPRARSLYERKGFREVSSSKTHIHLAWECTNSIESDKLKTTRASN
jgi:ribosomal protein S18 acetylase RimI-like enzyme